jgi:hypothetical protein
MMDVSEVIRWLNTLTPGSSVAIDDGGLALREINSAGRQTDAFLEIGGHSAEDELAKAASGDQFVADQLPEIAPGAGDVCATCGNPIAHNEPHLVCDDCRERNG